MTSKFPEPIAIVGSGCRFPGGSTSPSSLWDLLEKPRDIRKEIPADRFDIRSYYHPDSAHHGTTNVRYAYLLEDDVRDFDSGFFNISRKEADSIDPQQRLLMETVYEALESGGHTLETLRGTDTSVYVGVMGLDYEGILMRDVDDIPTYTATGISRAILSNRISYFFDWHGPSLTIDTACSSSLIAVHQGVQTLRTGDSRLAVACGTTVILGPDPFMTENRLNMLSPNGRSRMWDSEADGYARGEGVAVVVLKKLSDAIADGDHIECIIRETGTNQDGRSAGLTVPSSDAQASLIRQTYAKAGLDPRNPKDRPQFFEAHGTGTKAGDPREAEAIQQCFGWGVVSENDDLPRPANFEHPLYVGSIKTVIGHTEGAAGLAGLIKGSLAIQNGMIPPNLLFNNLNPSIEPFYNGLVVPTKLVDWPMLPEGVPRRVSINSFGFGGSNAHAILESYQAPKDMTTQSLEPRVVAFSPFTFSAASESSLFTLLAAYSEYLKAHPDINLYDLAWTLQKFKSTLNIKMSFSAQSLDRLTFKLDEVVEKMKGNDINIHSFRSAPKIPRILGIFTGQGAQWATMGGCLLRSSAFVRERFDQLDRSLANLPPSDRPEWRLRDEILAGEGTSQLTKARISQPVCTAIQIVLADLLREAGVTFEAVVGHSSGEIAAAYTAGFISAQDAIRIAYYRGLHAHLAEDLHGSRQKGAMLAVGTSFEDAQDLVDLPAFKNRISIAAHNSSASVTLSGNVDAIIHAKKVFDEEKKFARMLKVDTAYHSHHMIPCGDAYVESLRTCGIQVQEGQGSCSWFSSVMPGAEPMMPQEVLKDIYWKDNMVKPVLFADAIKFAANDKLNFALEIGPHPALKGPATQTIMEIRPPMPYGGVLSRGIDDTEAFADAIGFIWAQLGSDAVDFQAYEEVMATGPPPKFVLGLPSYPWNHERKHWHESRQSNTMRTRNEPFHTLLGTPTPDSTNNNRRWKNLLKQSEIPWLDGHRLQGQMIFPGAGYIAMALEAARKIAGDKEVKVYEICDLVIAKAISFEEDPNFAVETLITLSSITPIGHYNRSQTAEFSCHSCANNGPLSLDLVASGSVTIVYGASSPTTLTSFSLNDSLLNDIDANQFYESISEIGYGYTGPFRAMSSIKRKLDHASALVTTYSDPDNTDLLVHPSWLDVAIQSSLVAGSHPEDESFRTLSVPTLIGRIRVNPLLCAVLPTSGTLLPICASIHREHNNSFSASIDIFSEDGKHALIQAEDLSMKPLYAATAEDDRCPFTYVDWGVSMPDTSFIPADEGPPPEDRELAILCERMSYLYLRKWQSEISDDEWARGQPHHHRLRDYMNHTLSIISRGEYPGVKEEWANDTLDDLKPLMEKHSNSVDLRILKATAENIPAVVRGETTMLEHLNSMRDELYVDGLGFGKYSEYLAGMVEQLVHRYPRARILEIGAGTGGTTKEVLQAVGDAFYSYTFTDISESFFDDFGKTEEAFRRHSHKMSFKLLDIEKSPASQGFESHSYDIVIVANVVHATSSCQRTLANTRQLLKPGGHLVLVEITQPTVLRCTNMAAGLPGWWGSQDGRKNGPLVTTDVWHSLLRQSGFSGIDAITPQADNLTWPFSAMVTQATNSQVDFLRRPLSSSPLALHFEEIVILGTGSLDTSHIAEEVAELLSSFGDKITILHGLPTESDTILPMNTLISLVDLDEPVFKNLSQKKWDGLKRIYEVAKNLLWVTRGAQDDDPYQMASIGLGRAIRPEIPYLTLTSLDLSHSNHNTAKIIAECLLRQCALDEWHSPGLVWSTEPEYVLENGRLMVPRLVANHSQNDRFNAQVRPITRTVSSSAVHISEFSEWPPYLQEDIVPPVGRDPKVVKIQHSVLMALNVAPNAFLFPFMGLDEVTGKPVLGLCKGLSSRIKPIVAIPCKSSSPSVLSAIIGELLAVSLLSLLPLGSSILIHELNTFPAFAMSLTERAKSKDVRIFFSTSSTGMNDPAWIPIDAWTPKHILRRKLPAQATHFLDFSTNSGENAISLSIRDALPSSCKHIDISDLFRRQCHAAISDRDNLVDLLNDVALRASHYASQEIPLGPIVPLCQISQVRDPLTIVDWKIEDATTLQITPINGKTLFSKDKTYLLVGLTGQIGQSLCEWMARSGAGCICLTSRNPNVSEKWLKLFEDFGTIVKVFTMDVSSKQSVRKVIGEIRNTCPPIAGVANGAMVLNDVLLADMSLDMMTQVLKPKIDGSNYLAEAFHNDRLDFFVMFSSLSAVVGNPGQSNYAAANAYMQSLAKQRRKRGLAGSTFDIGRVVGIGYVERADPLVKEQLVRQKYLPISESDFHQLFAETILASHPDINTASPVLTTAIFSAIDDEYRPRWADDPRFSHCIRADSKGTQAERDTRNNTIPVFDQLANTQSMDEALSIVEASFISQLRIILQITDQDIDQNAALIELGIDSLVAVEVRTWFVKELKVDLPVLKILGGASIANLSAYALENLPEKVLATIGKSGNAKNSSKVLPSTIHIPQPQLQSKSEIPLSTPSESTENTPRDSTSANISSTASSTGSEELLQPEDIASTEALKPSPTFIKSEPLSFAQSRFWFLRRLLQDQTTFTVSFYYKISGDIRVNDLERAIAAVGSRHEALRTAFVGNEKETDMADQKIMTTSLLKLEHRNIQGIEDVAAAYTDLKNYQFDIEHGEVIRMILLSLDPSTTFLLIGYHHIIMDGISISILLRDLEKAYKGKSLGAAPRQITSFSKNQHEAYAKGNMEDSLRYWRGIFPDEPPVLPLLPMAVARSRTSMDVFDVHQVHCLLDPGLTARVKQMSKSQRSTPFHLYLAVFKSMLFKFTEVQALTIGIADAGRGNDDMNTVGLLLNLLTLRFRRKPGQRFADAIIEARGVAYAALASSVPFDVLLKDLNVPRSSHHSPFFQVFMDYRQGTKNSHAFDNCQFEMQDAALGRTAYDITLDINESVTGTIVAIRTQSSLYSHAATDLLLNTYIGLLEAFSSDASLEWESVPLFSDKLLVGVVDLGRGPSLESDWPETLVHRIEQVAGLNENMDNIALIDGLISPGVTYANMIKRVGAIGEALANAGLDTPGSRILVFQQASSDWVCSMLAIMRVGGIYIPYDLRNPLPRLASIAQDCQPGGILVDTTTAEDAKQLSVQATIINISNVGSKPQVHVPNRARGDSIAAILYTSGSTGQPKGVLVKHSALRNEIEGYTKTWKLGAERVLQQSAFTFNHSLDQMYTGLVNGGSVYIVPGDQRGDPQEITDIIKQYEITYTKATPSEYSLWLQYGIQNLRLASSWRFAFGGGETLTSSLLQDFQALDLPLRFFNSYGPTEISISSHKMEIAYHEEVPEVQIPCGYSLPNYVTYILDDQLKPVPCGMPGEVYIGGAGVAEGYLNNKDLADQVFVHNPYATSHPGFAAAGWTRMYRTGDIGHLNSNGALVFHSRVAGDSQVKIRGIRIELNDIESNILVTACGELREAVVTLREDDILVAHVVFASTNDRANKDEYLDHLLSRLPLPQYMIPVTAVHLDHLPLSSHGKIDRNAIRDLPLSLRITSITANGYLEFTETMVQLKHVWEDVLCKQFGFSITPSTSFFAVGGNSLLILRLQSRIRDVFNVAIRLVELLSANTLAEMARKIEGSSVVEIIDWDKETALPDLGISTTDFDQRAHPIRAHGKTVLLTGSTGFLARPILAQLATNPNVNKICCVAVRDASSASAPHGQKITLYDGDLTQPLLGLSESTFSALSNEVDVILHMGAARSFWDSYHTLRPTNVHATKELVKMAAPQRIPIHYISSAGVLQTTSGIGVSAAENVPPVDGSDGYVATKWASERILERAAEMWGVPVSIHRFVPCEETKPSNMEPVLEDFVRCADLSKTVPDLDGWEGRIDLVSTLQAATELSEAAIHEKGGKSDAARFVHHLCEVSIDVNGVKAYMQEQRGNAGYEKVAGVRWTGKIKALGFQYLFASQHVNMNSKMTDLKLESRR